MDRSSICTGFYSPKINPELCRSYVREPRQLGPIQAKQKPSLEAALEEQEPQTEDPSLNILLPSSTSPQPYKPLYPSMSEMQPEPLFLLLEAVGGPLGITRVHTPSSLSDFNQCRTCLGKFSNNPSWFTKEFQPKSLPWAPNSSKSSYWHRLQCS